MNHENTQYKEAESYRASAEHHKQEVKSAWGTFWKSGVFVLAALGVLFFIGLAWYMTNNRVKSGSASVSAQAAVVRIASKGDRQTAEENSQLGLQDGETLEYHGETYYYVEDGEIAMRLSQDYSVSPGTSGSIEFYIIPVSNGKRSITLSLGFAGYQKDEDGKAVPAEDKTLEALLKGHILLFEDYENGFYSGWLYDSSDNGIYHNTITITLPEDAETDVPYPYTLYWIWPKRYENLVLHRVDQNDLFAQDSDEFQDSYLPFLDVQSSDENRNPIPGTNYSYSALFLANSWPLEKTDARSKAYNLADEYIGTNADYLYLTIRTSAQSGNHTDEGGTGA